MYDLRHEVDDVFWLERYDTGDTFCFKAEGDHPVWCGENWQSGGGTKWYYVAYAALEKEYGIDFRDYMPEETRVLLEVTIQDGDVLGTRLVYPPRGG